MTATTSQPINPEVKQYVFVRRWNGSGNDRDYPSHNIALDSSGHLFMMFGNKVRKFDSNGISLQNGDLRVLEMDNWTCHKVLLLILKREMCMFMVTVLLITS
jgi:hypothetical protein